MGFRLALAISVSVVLIGVSSWYRFGTTGYVQPNVVAIDQLGTSNDDYAEILNDFTIPKTSTSSVISAPLTNTDLIGRQLILDYVGLAGSGQATEANIISLANQYAENITIFNKATKIGAQDIKTVSNTKVNLENYSDNLAKIYMKHAGAINKAYAEKPSADALDKMSYSFAKNASATYTNTATELKNLTVPLILAATHLELVNIHLSSASAMNAIFEAEEDPITAVAGFIIVNENLDKEITVLKEIEQILQTNAI
ncbi:MAG: hypothetical protein A3C70_02520 [Candidatus Zambryskibacteria bacterium RIFCSPHIGHO2_02_FULL_43_14]|uniref:Uncharacterized protein n=1 Tax=Candidatus Zambryskibacteria bacterium RIFCSPHIGHO2_02_FULL_43_14 TaxID=1802748 RepID=A0A1G2TIA6_9BACT|nr:MAG: hypothetical protein A2829_00210 [Candidatus Zambryskibacteria bacterium RIFCSPHIGHO2_01_FULL_43_60]OHA97030.1 MAG: hypothetical protein A3C70_02520 [Candidatus Zambryskibacteria bacterium RIFCSPHIGHO2_02_FULL_43_14]OHB03755.1 MAG: hypothetical protein A3B03_02075 [Candidatus Zambryskibacteria bacterium RIFCSPLOWO2_01_FULL_42_41]